MANHLTPDQVVRFLDRTLSQADFLALDEHLATCESCRQAVSDPEKLQAHFEALRHDLESGQLKLTHLSYEQLEAYVDNDIEPAEREIVESHVEICKTCHAELQDLQEFRSSLQSRDGSGLTLQENVDAFTQAFGRGEKSAGQPTRVSREEPLTIYASADDQASRVLRSENAIQKLIHFWRHPAYLVAVSVALACVVLAVIFLPLSYYAPLTAHLTPAPQPPGVAPHAEDSFTVNPELHIPDDLDAAVGTHTIVASIPRPGVSFGLVSPVGTFVEDTKPVFRWQKLSGASRYRVIVVDSELHEVLRSPEISGTTWQPSQTLERGKLYQWQVTAFRGSEQIISPESPASRVKFGVIQQSQADELTQLKRAKPANHFALGYGYANAGVLDRAVSELHLVPRSDTNYDLAQKFLSQIAVRRMLGKVPRGRGLEGRP